MKGDLYKGLGNVVTGCTIKGPRSMQLSPKESEQKAGCTSLGSKMP